MKEVRVRITARIRFLSAAEGGRGTALRGKSRYSPNHNLFGSENREMCLGSIDLDAREIVHPGDTIEKTISFLLPAAQEPEIEVGREWRVQEGLQLVAIGTVLKLLD